MCTCIFQICVIYRVIDNSSGEFGIVYKARLASPHGRYSREVAVKTLKGKYKHLFNYRVCVGSVMCKVIPWSQPWQIGDYYVTMITVYEKVFFTFCV